MLYVETKHEEDEHRDRIREDPARAYDKIEG